MGKIHVNDKPVEIGEVEFLWFELYDIQFDTVFLQMGLCFVYM